MIDAKGVLNPGLMPQRLDDLHHIAPPRTEVDDVLVERWNRVAEVWRMDPKFRVGGPALRHHRGASRRGQHRAVAGGRLSADRAGPVASPGPLPHREGLGLPLRPVLHVPDAGVMLDRAWSGASRRPLVAQLDDSLNLLVESPRLEDEEADPFAPRRRGRSPGSVDLGQRQPGQPGRARRRPGRRRRARRRPADRPQPAPLHAGGAARALEGGLRGAAAGAGPARGQAADPPPRPGRRRIA